MKKTTIYILILIILALSFFFFEPIFTYTSGWSNLPKTGALKPITVHQDPLLKKGDSLLKVIYTKLKAPAVSIAVGRKGKTIWANAIGYQNIENQTFADTNTLFRIGSTSKAVTSLGIGVLMQNKKISLDNKVKDFVPYASNHLAELTLKQLASHTSGIRNYGTCLCFPIWEYYNNTSFPTVKKSIQVFNNDKLLFTPGEDFSYSTYNYTLLSAMIEGASGLPFPEYMNDFIFKPLQAEHIIVETSETLKKASNFYEIDDQKYKKVYPVNNSNKWAGGGFLATPTDLTKIGNALLNHQLFNDQTTNILTTPVSLNNNEINKQNYAIGWRSDTIDLFNSGDEINVWHHGGIANGSISLLALFPDHNLSVSMLANKNGSSSDLFENVYAVAKVFIAEKDQN